MEKKDNKSLIWIIIAVVVIVIVVIVVALVSSNSNNNKSLSAAQKRSDSQQIETNWKTFFLASTTLQKRESLLQNGSSFTTQIDEEFQAFGAEHSYATVSNVSVTSSTAASVTYTVYLQSEPALSNQLGSAVFVNNTWKVSDSTVCGLLGMAGDKPAVCKNY